MNIIEFSFIIAIFARGQLVVDIAWSSFTNPVFVSNITSLLQQNFQDQFEFNLTYLDIISGYQQFRNSPDIIFDITFSSLLAESIKEFAAESSTIIASISKSVGTYSDWEFFTHSSWENQMEALSCIISYLNWTTFIVISDEIYNEDDEFFYYFSKKDYHWFYFANSNDRNSSDLFIGKVIQATGIKNIVILNFGESTKLLLDSISQQSLLIKGAGVIVGSKGSWGLYGDGVIAYAESGLESADSYSIYEGLAFVKFLNLILSFPSAFDSLALLEFLNKNTVDHHQFSYFTLLNIEENEKIMKGKIYNGNLTISKSLTYPGNSSIIPNSPTTDVNVWIADGTINPGTDPDLLARQPTAGEFYALSYWKNMHSLDGFEITVTHTDCGVTVFDLTYAYSCFSKLLATPGVGYLTSLYPFIAIGNILALRSLNLSMPHISAYGPSALSLNNTLFPEFMTIIKDETFNTQVILDLAVIFGWKHFVLIYDENNLRTYSFFLSKVKQYNMIIANGPDLRQIDAYYTRDKYPQWKNWFTSLINLKVRLLVSFLTPPYGFHVAESFYDAGLRTGDMIILCNARMAYAIPWETDLVQRRKVIEVFYGAIAVAQAEWIGEYGQMLSKGFIKEYGNQLEFRCLAFDSAMLLLNGIAYTIKHGGNVKDYETLNINIRKQKFLGCSGTVSIEPGSNQRSLPTFGIFSLRWNETTQEVYEEFTGLYDLSSAQLITFYSQILWYDNTTNVPTDLITYENGCPFPAKMIYRSKKGAGMLYGISIGIIIITIIESIFIWNKLWKKIRIQKLVIPSYVQFEDYIMMTVLVIDFFQFISQGPDISGLYGWLSLLCTYTMTNFDSTVRGDIYWAYLYTAMTISCFWMFTAFLLFYRLNKLLSEMLRHIKNLSLLLLPIIGNIAFVPMVSVLLSIFQCDQGIGSKITDSFIRHDCTTHCWDNAYTLWGVFAIISLLAYIPLTIYLRYFYEIVNDHINIRTNPIFIVEKVVCQIIIIVMNQTVKIYSQSLHGFCCCILFLVMTLICFKQSPYNYHRMNLWIIISYLAILWSFILSSIYWISNFSSQNFWIALHFWGWFILIAAGIAIQCKWCPSLLNTDKVLDIAIFFKFEIGSAITAAELNRMKKNLNNSRYSNKSKESIIINSTRIIPTINDNVISE